MPNFLWKLLLPFIAIWAIVLGFLRQIRIFNKSEKLEIIISFTMAFLTLPSRIFVGFVGFFAGLSAAVAVTIYFSMFIIGVAFYSVRFWRRENLSNEILKAYYKRKNNRYQSVQNSPIRQAWAVANRHVAVPNPRLWLWGVQN